jgi:hypothetical protein
MFIKENSFAHFSILISLSYVREIVSKYQNGTIQSVSPTTNLFSPVYVAIVCAFCFLFYHCEQRVLRGACSGQ